MTQELLYLWKNWESTQFPLLNQGRITKVTEDKRVGILGVKPFYFSLAGHLKIMSVGQESEEGSCIAQFQKPNRKSRNWCSFMLCNLEAVATISVLSIYWVILYPVCESLLYFYQCRLDVFFKCLQLIDISRKCIIIMNIKLYNLSLNRVNLLPQNL